METNTSASGERDPVNLQLCAVLGITHDDVRGTVETAKPVLRIWAQGPQYGHSSMHQRYCCWLTPLDLNGMFCMITVSVVALLS